MNFQNPYLNPYGVPQPMIQQLAQPVQVVKVNGEKGNDGSVRLPPRDAHRHGDEDQDQAGDV